MNTTTDTTMTATFTPDTSLACRSIGDHNCVFRFDVLKRTAKFVTLVHHGKTYRVGIKFDRDGGEYCYPLGSFSMAPVLRAGITVAQ